MYFIQEKCCELTKSILLQDKKSTILLAKNGQFHSSKRTKLIKNMYFMIKDMIGKGEVVIRYFPISDMWANTNTKALQGSLFYKIRSCLMGIGEDYDDDIERLNNHPDPSNITGVRG